MSTEEQRIIPPVEFPKRPYIRERNGDVTELPPPPNPTETMSEMLHRMAKQEVNTPPEIRGFAPSSIRTLAKMANQIADEHGIAQPAPTTIIDEGSPLKDLASILTGFTYGTMMQLAKELKATEGAVFDTPEGVAALLHSWATKTNSTPVSSLPTSTSA